MFQIGRVLAHVVKCKILYALFCLSIFRIQGLWTTASMEIYLSNSRLVIQDLVSL